MKSHSNIHAHIHAQNVRANQYVMIYYFLFIKETLVYLYKILHIQDITCVSIEKIRSK